MNLLQALVYALLLWVGVPVILASIYGAIRIVGEVIYRIKLGRAVGRALEQYESIYGKKENK